MALLAVAADVPTQVLVRALQAGEFHRLLVTELGCDALFAGEAARAGRTIHFEYHYPGRASFEVGSSLCNLHKHGFPTRVSICCKELQYLS